jgi:hypothetical protein
MAASGKFQIKSYQPTLRLNSLTCFEGRITFYKEAVELLEASRLTVSIDSVVSL